MQDYTVSQWQNHKQIKPWPFTSLYSPSGRENALPFTFAITEAVELNYNSQGVLSPNPVGFFFGLNSSYVIMDKHSNYV